MFRPMLPTTRQLFITSDHGTDPPMPRLLAIHRACCLVMHLSGVGDYVKKVLWDMEEIGVKSDGTTELGNMMNLRLCQRRRVGEGVLESLRAFMFNYFHYIAPIR